MDPRKYSAAASATPPTAPVSPSVGYPTEGNPSTGTPATKPGAHWFYKIGEELRNIIAAAGITPDDADLTQLLTALRNTGVFATQAQFDNTTKVATTAFVRQAQGNPGGISSFNASTTLTAANSGSEIFFYGSTAAQTITLPAVASIPAGQGGLWISNYSTVTVTIKGSGAEQIFINSLSNVPAQANTLVLSPSDSTFLIAGSSNWIEQAGMRIANINGAFGVSGVTNGYQKLASGLIIQWGTANSSSSAGVQVNFPIAFPNNCFTVVGTHTGATVNPDVVSTRVPTLTQFTLDGYLTNTGARAVIQVGFIAIGN